MPKTTFLIENDGGSDLRLFLELEGIEFRLPPAKSVEVHAFGSVR